MFNSRGDLPKNIFFLTCDAFGVLPPISKLTKEQAMYHFVNGYTAKIAGTETGITEPLATFSSCFGAPFLPLHPLEYANMLGEKIEDSMEAGGHAEINIWLVNTGWTGGQYGVGRRIELSYTRSLIKAALEGDLTNVAYQTEDYFGLSVPQACPDVPNDILNPINTWDDKEAYAKYAENLQRLFKTNYAKYADKIEVSTEV